MDRNPNSFNNFSNHSTIDGGFTSDLRSEESTSPVVLLNDSNVSSYMQNQVSTEGLVSNHNLALTSYGGGQFGLGQRLHELRRGGNTLISFPEVKHHVLIASNVLRQNQSRGLIPVCGFTQTAISPLTLRTELSSPSFTSPNILSDPICQNPSVFFSNQVAPLQNGSCCCCCPCHGHSTTALPSYFLTPSPNSSDLQCQNNWYLQNPMKPNSNDSNPVLHQRPVSVHQGIMFNADPIRVPQVPNNNVNAVTSPATIPRAEPLNMLIGKQKRDELVQAIQIQPSNKVCLNEHVGDVNNVSADGRPVETPSGDIFLGNDGRVHTFPRDKDDPYTCPRCNVGFQSSQTFAAHIVTVHFQLDPSDQRLKRKLLNSRGRSNHISHPSAQVKPKPLFKQTSMGKLKIPTDELKKHIAEASRQTDAEQSGVNTVSQGISISNGRT